MIVVKLMGGLGNQMFQYAAGRCLSEKHHTALKLDLAFLLDRTPRNNFVYRDYDLGIFNVREDFALPDEVVSLGRYRRMGRMIYAIRQRLNSRWPVYMRESIYHFDPRFSNIPAHAYIDGYWQSERYFKDVEIMIRKEFTFRMGLDNLGNEMARKIQSVNAVCLNVRRGDYVASPSANQHHGVCEMDYFLHAVEMIASVVNKPHFFVFSDDIEWCHGNLRFNYPSTFVGHDYAGAKFGQYLQLMTMCNHYIIPNSSFGWWAAWLNPNPDKFVIAPKRWYKNPRMDTQYLTPDGWLRI